MLRPISLAAFAIFAISLPIVVPAAAQNAPQVNQPVDDSHRATLAGNTRPEANGSNDRGIVSDGLELPQMLLQLKRSPAQDEAAAAFVNSLYDPASPHFHQWITPADYGAKFGVNQSDIAKVTGWLKQHGFTVNRVYPNGMLIDFSGTAGQVRATFKSEIHHLDVNGEAHIGNMSDVQIPPALASVVAGIVSLHDFKPRHSTRRHPAFSFTSGGFPYNAMTPGDLAIIYNIKPLFSAGVSGTGQTIAVIEDSFVYSTADWTAFRSKFGLSGYTHASFTQIHPGNNCTAPGVQIGDDFEGISDAEWASAAAPNAAIVLAACASTNTTFGVLIALQNLINGANPPKIISISYGECEADNGAASNAAYNAAFQQAASHGISVFVIAGDWGAAICDAGINNDTVATHGISVSAYASTPWAVAVGGTDFEDYYLGTLATYWNTTNSATYVSAKSYIPEIPWNDSCAGTLLANYFSGSPITYGSSGFCNSSSGRQFRSITAGGGGPSRCATGKPSIPGVVSGTCKGYAKPSWQSVLGNPADGVRDIPDVSLFAGDGLWGHYYIVCYSNPVRGAQGYPCTGSPANWASGGGTSFATPIMAGIQALVNQKLGAPQGLPNPVYYALAAAEYSASKTKCLSSRGAALANAGCIFNDIAVGDMDINCTGTHSCYLPSASDGVLSTSNNGYLPAFAARTGWDFATGLGSVNALHLVNGWSSVTPLAVTKSAPLAPSQDN
jgi:subtilase family serine protease